MSSEQGIGQILAIDGAEAVLVRCAGNQLKSLEVGDWLQAGDMVLAAPGVSLQLGDAGGQALVLPPGAETLVSIGMFDSPPPGIQRVEIADESVDDLIASILAGEDFEKELEATAAGLAGGGDGEGSSFIRLSRIAESVDQTNLNSPRTNRISYDRKVDEEGSQPPQARDDTVTVAEDDAVAIDVLANDSDPDGGPLSITGFTQAEHGSVSQDPASGLLVYTPAAEYNGPDAFHYTVADPAGYTSSATVSIDVIPVNDMPLAQPDVATTPEDVPVTIDVLSNDSDSDNDPLSIIAIDGQTVASGDSVRVAHGTATLNPDGTVEYTPAPEYNGSDSFTYTISDGQGGSATTTVEVLVTPVDDDPANTTNAVADAFVTDEDVALNISAAELLANDSDAEGDPLTISAYTQPAHGSLEDDGQGVFVYKPDPDFNGQDSFSYTLDDGRGASDTTTVSLQVNPVNDPPVAADDNATTREDVGIDIDVLANDSDIDGDVLGIESFTQAINGSVTANADGTLHYAPNSGYHGSDSFSYVVSDGAGGTGTATVTLTVTPDGDPPIIVTNNPPVAMDDAYATTEDVALNVQGSLLDGLLANDSDPDGDSLTLNTTPVADVQHGTLTLNPDGSFNYVPDADFNGNDSFVYQVRDSHGLTDTATVRITVGDINDPPTAGDDSAATPEETAVVVDVTGNDGDVDGSIVSWTVDAAPAHGTLVNHGDGSFTYTPETDYNGSDSFSYHVTDDDGATSNVATVSLTVEPGNDGPVITTPNVNSVSEAELVDAIPGPVEASGTVSATDEDGDTLAYTLNAPSLALASGGHPVSWSGNGSETLTASAGGVPVASLSITSTGAYLFTLLAPLDHPEGTPEDTLLTLDFGVTASDGSLSDSTTLNIGVVDDSPDVTGTENVSVGYTIGDSASGALGTAFGADGPADPLGVELNLGHGDPATYTNTASNSSGPLSSGGTPLNWYTDGAGSWYAATAEGGTHIIEVALSQDGYLVTVTGELDGASHTQTVPLNSDNEDLHGGHQGTATVDLDFSGNGSFDAYLQITGTDGDGSGAVNWNNNWMGVADATTIDVSETLSITFRDYGAGTHSGNEALLPVSRVQVGLAHFGGDDAGTWMAYNGANLVANGSFNTSTAADGSLTIAPGAEFTTVVFAATQGDYGVSTLQLSSQVFVEGIDQRIDLGFTASDTDGDSDTGSFSATIMATDATEGRLLTQSETDHAEPGLNLLGDGNFNWSLADADEPGASQSEKLIVFSRSEEMLELADLLPGESGGSLSSLLRFESSASEVVAESSVGARFADGYDAGAIEQPGFQGEMEPLFMAHVDSGLQLIQDLLNKGSLSAD